MACIWSPLFAILINEMPSEFFHSIVGQADALSQGLHAVSLGMGLDPYVPASGVQSISHLLFADDCLLLGQATLRNAIGFRRILEDCCGASGQNVNLSKSTVLFSLKTSAQLRHLIQDWLGVAEHNGVLQYLEISISGSRLRVVGCVGME